MHDTALVSGAQALTGSHEHVEDLVGVPLGRQPVPPIHALEQLEHEVAVVIDLAVVVEPHDAGMVDAREQLALAPRHALLRGDDLDGDAALELDVEGLVDAGERALADHPQQPVPKANKRRLRPRVVTDHGLEPTCGSPCIEALVDAASRGQAVIHLTRVTATDEELLALVQERDGSAGAELFNRHWTWLIEATRALGVTDGSEEDIVHELWVEIWNCPPRLEHGNFRAWLWGALRKRAASHHRQSARAEPLGSSISALACATPIQVFAPVELRRVTRRARERGDIDSDDVLATAIWSEGATSQEVGDWLDRSSSSVRDWWQRSLRKLRALERDVD